jgi:Ser-tRNA(Ala) deacylase AlaX
MATLKLFWKDPYLKECEATVISIDENEITLDRTIFYAFSGGQSSDSGFIGEIPVKEAIVRGEDIIYVLEEEPNFKVGDKVIVRIDWDKRYKIMKLHSAAHVIFFIFEEKTKAKKIIGSNVNEEKSRLDYLYEENISEFLPEVEKEANEEIFSNDMKVKTYFDKENPEKRWWELPKKGWKCPCGGTHVKNMNEIKTIRLKRKNIGKGKERIEIYLGC